LVTSRCIPKWNMENRALRLPRAEPLLHVPVSAIVEFVSNRSEAEVLLRIGDLGHEFDHLTRTLVQWLEHEQHLTADGCLQEEEQPVEDTGESLVLSLVPFSHQARVVNRHGVRVLQQKITECLQQLQRFMDAVQVFANQNASFSQELRLCGLGDRAEQRRRLAETESALARRLAKFLGGCDSFYDEQPLPLAMQFAAAEEAAAKTAVAPAEAEAVKFKQTAPAVAPREGAAASLAVAAPQEEEEGEEEEQRKKKRHAGAGAGKSCPADGHDDDPKSNLGSRTATGSVAGRKRPLPPTGRSVVAVPESTGAGAAGKSTSEQQQQQQQQLSQDQEDRLNHDPPFLTPPVIVDVAPATGGGSGSSSKKAATSGGGGDGGGGGASVGPRGPLVAPLSACSSSGSTPSSASLSPALVGPSPSPTPRSLVMRREEGRPGAISAGSTAAFGGCSSSS
ncbi:unnamed protein product, partial [Ectocarpus sp. 12 AP-2014]